MLDERVRRKMEIFEYYRAALEDLPGIEFMPEPEWSRSNRWLTVLTVDPNRCGVSPNGIIDALEQENVEARPVWNPLHMQPLFKKCAYYPHRIGESISEGLFEKGLCLPSGTAMTDGDIDRVVKVIKKCKNLGI